MFIYQPEGCDSRDNGKASGYNPADLTTILFLVLTLDTVLSNIRGALFSNRTNQLVTLARRHSILP